MQLVLFDSLLWTEWISFIFSVGIFGLFVLFEDTMPDQLSRVYKYGKAMDLHQKSTLNKLELPKSWFYQFYLFATVFYTYLLISVIRVYIFGEDLPEFTQYLLDNVVGSNRKARVPCESVLLALILILIQVSRRLLECLFLSVYSKAKMNIVHYVIAMSYYFGVGLSILAEANGLSSNTQLTFIDSSIKWRNFISSRHLIGIALFVIASYLHFKSHHILASLRKDKQGKVISYKHVIPTGGLFSLVSCPHYFAEILIYISIAIVQSGLSFTWWLVVAFVITNQVIMGLINHQCELEAMTFEQQSLSEIQSMNHEPFDRAIKHASQFEPYQDNGGSIVAIAGDDFAIIASDLRIKSGYSVGNRNVSKLYPITDKIVLGSTGCLCDSLTFSRILEFRKKMYRYDNNQEMSIEAVSQLVAIMLYNRRFFPYYVSNVLAGVDEDGKGYIYRYDPVGCKELIKYAAEGSAGTLINPILVGLLKNESLVRNSTEDERISLESALIIVKDVFRAASEREVTCGDGILIHIITKNGIKQETLSLRKD